LGQHRVVGVVHLDELVALVRERRARLLEIAVDRFLAVVDLAGGDQLVAWVLERAHGDVELVAILRLHVLANDLLADVFEGHAATLSVATPGRQSTGHSAPVRRACRTRSVSGGLRPTLRSVTLAWRRMPSGSMRNVPRSAAPSSPRTPNARLSACDGSASTG